MRRSDTFRGDRRANRDDAVMARGTEGQRESERGGGTEEGRRKQRSRENLVKSTRVEKREGTRRVLRYAPGLCKYHSAVI